MRHLSILGSTGSIGKQTLEVCRKAPADFTVEGLSCGSDIDTLYEQIKEFSPKAAAVSDESKGALLAKRLKEEGISTEIYTGPSSSTVTATLSSCDTVVGAIVGFAGLEPVYHAIKEGKTIALANKETLVSGGDFIMPLAKEKGVDILPIDSEHSAIWQCIRNGDEKNLDRILITASGGPFRGKSRDELVDVTAEKALNHPTWKMGGKITIDSATMMNKGLEIIEAHHLFGVSVDSIDVVVHPQSVVHSMVMMKDGSVLGQMGRPSMILPILVALYYPERGPAVSRPFNPFEEGCNNLTFEKCDTDVFRLVGLAYDVGRQGGLLPAVMNAANETAVMAFLAGKIGFLDIEKTVFDVCSGFAAQASVKADFDTVRQADAEARSKAEEIIRKYS